ncbi:polysaccharide biosynthesis tyrosine autokinase [uncultured Gordonia sp.]|uniref:polysaccharide biosynthesis tyrosine autokinase n=1 Tax=uncultured Gordonia sp. TaxID=198437 RepID=UPI002586EB56|nr:polysaccharide biosynthesis tyrosine autokinase [uncultured Gordonia sp.]
MVQDEVSRHSPAFELPLRSSIGLLRRSWWILVLSLLFGGLLALVYSLLQTPVYSSSTVLYVTAGSDDNTQAAYQGSLASQQRVASYAKLATSDTVVRKALEESGLKLSVDDAKNAISATGSPNTVLLSISAMSVSPEEASVLANAVARSLSESVRSLETTVAGARPLAALTVVTPATVSTHPMKPKTAMNVMIGSLLGVILGLIWVLFIVRLSTRIRSSVDVELAGDTNVLAVVPSSNSHVGKVPVRFGEDVSSFAESYRRLCTSVSFLRPDSPPRSFLVSSANVGEGKTTTAINFAACLAERGHNVVLVDGDMRRPAVAERLGLSDAVGLSDVLVGRSALSDALQTTGVAGLTVLGCGRVPPNPGEVVASVRTGKLLEDLKNTYDFIVIDSPPIVPVADAVSIARWVDGAILVVRSGSSRLQDFLGASRQLTAASIDLLGAVLNAASGTGRGYGYSSDYYMREESIH